MRSYAKFFNEEMDEDIAVDEIEAHVINWLKRNEIELDDMDEADQNGYVMGILVEATRQYVAYCWKCDGYGDYHWESDNNRKLKERAEKWVYDLQPRLSFVRVLNRLKERTGW